jgi:hypothetical protein
MSSSSDSTTNQLLAQILQQGFLSLQASNEANTQRLMVSLQASNEANTQRLMAVLGILQQGFLSLQASNEANTERLIDVLALLKERSNSRISVASDHTLHGLPPLNLDSHASMLSTAYPPEDTVNASAENAFLESTIETTAGSSSQIIENL